MNRTKNYIWAVLASIPLVPFVITDINYLYAPINGREVTQAAPVVLQGLVFYVLYKFVETDKRQFSSKEQQALWVLALGHYVIFGLPVLLLTILGENDSGISDLGYSIMMLYSIASTAFVLRRIISHGQRIFDYFIRRYLLPLIAAIILTFVFAFMDFGINMAAVFYILGNFALASGYVSRDQAA